MENSSINGVLFLFKFACVAAAISMTIYCAYDFSKNEDLASGTITWTRTGGTADPNSPHRITLSENEMKKGVRANYTLSNATQLVDGGIYDILFQLLKRQLSRVTANLA